MQLLQLHCQLRIHIQGVDSTRAPHVPDQLGPTNSHEPHIYLSLLAPLAGNLLDPLVGLSRPTTGGGEGGAEEESSLQGCQSTAETGIRVCPH